MLLKRIVLLSCISVFSLLSVASLAETKWELVWADEFDKEGPPDPSKWSHVEGFVANRELQYYTNREVNSRVRNGALVIEARKETYPNAAFDPKEKDRYQKMWKEAEYTSARLITKDKAEWQYGKIEVRAKIPTGRGMWPAIWLLGHDISEVGWPEVGEIDIMENVGFDPNTIHANIHTKKYNHIIETNKGASIQANKPWEAYHVYSMEWDENVIDFFYDGKKYFTYKNEKTGTDAWPFDKNYYLILNVAVGGGWGGEKGVDESLFPNRMYVDYVRVYKKK